MICELNRVYIISASKAADGMTSGEDEFIESTSNDMTYVYMGKIRKAKEEDKTITSFTKIFNHDNIVMQATIFVNDLPEKVAKRNITHKIKKIQEAEKNK